MQHLNWNNYSECHQLLSDVTEQYSGHHSGTGDHFGGLAITRPDIWKCRG